MKAVIFDMDGVVIDSMKYHVPCWIDALKFLGIHADEADVYLKEGMNFEDTLKTFSNEYKVSLDNKTEEEINEARIKCIHKNFKIEVYAGVIEFISLLKNKNIKTALVTGSNKELANKVVKENLNNLFDVVITSDDVQHSKPYPEPYLKAVKMLNINKNDCVVIENAPLGIKSAKDAGLFVFGLETTLHKKELHEANMIFSNHKNLFEYLRTKLNI
ncbi:MAG: HAD family hydrolase [Candidatus Woesearchaeota archaeon]